MSTAPAIPAVRGKLKARAPLAPLVWFKSGGNAEWLFEPADRDDLVEPLDLRKGLAQPHRDTRHAAVADDHVGSQAKRHHRHVGIERL